MSKQSDLNARKEQNIDPNWIVFEAELWIFEFKRVHDCLVN